MNPYVSPDRNLGKIEPELALRVTVFLLGMIERGAPMFVTEGWRSWARQAYLYAKGRRTSGPKVTDAQPGTSKHEFGLAVDVAFRKAGDIYAGPWEIVGEEAARAGLKWGIMVRRKGKLVRTDYPHLELERGDQVEA